MAEARAHEDAPVTLDDYAFVTAGLSDGLGLDDLLDHRAIDPHAWGEAELYWLLALTDDAEQGALMSLKLSELMIEARTAWKRAVPPLDEDFRSWVDFERLLATHEDPLARLTELQLTPTDLLAVQEHWRGRLEADEELRKEWAEILKVDPEPVDVPPPAPRSLGVKPTVDGTGTFQALDDVDDVLPFAEATDQRPVREAPPLVAPMPKPPSPDVDMTASVHMLAEFDLPWLDGSDDQGDEADEAENAKTTDVETAARERESLQAASVVPAAPGDVQITTAAPSPVVDLNRTAVGEFPIIGDAVPFESDEAALWSRKPTAPVLTGLPFRAAPSSSRDDASAESSSPPQPVNMDETSATGVPILQDVLPFDSDTDAIAPTPSEPAPAHPDAGSTAFFDVAQFGFDDDDEDGLPFVSPTPEHAPLVPDGLTTNQLAAVIVELEEGDAPTVLARYGLSPARLGEHTTALQARLAGGGDFAAQWEHAKATYRAWKRGQR